MSHQATEEMTERQYEAQVEKLVEEHFAKLVEVYGETPMNVGWSQSDLTITSKVYANVPNRFPTSWIDEEGFINHDFIPLKVANKSKN